MFGMTLLGYTFSVMWAFMLLLIWVAIAFWPARVAARKGHSFFLYFILSLFFFPLALILAYVVSDKTVYRAQPVASAPAPATSEE